MLLWAVPGFTPSRGPRATFSDRPGVSSGFQLGGRSATSRTTMGRPRNRAARARAVSRAISSGTTPAPCAAPATQGPRAPISNPVRTRLFAPEPPVRTRYLSEREEERLRTAIGDEHWPKIVVAMHIGLDRGAQFALRWEQLDFQTRIIHAERRKGRRDGITPVTVAINDELLAVLRALPSRLNSPWVFPTRTAAALSMATSSTGASFNRPLCGLESTR